MENLYELRYMIRLCWNLSWRRGVSLTAEITTVPNEQSICCLWIYS